jgi:IS6 family transposase
MLGGDWTDGTMTDFKWRHFQGDVILWAVRWYCRYPISYRDLEEMLAERGISVDHTTIYRWVALLQIVGGDKLIIPFC